MAIFYVDSAADAGGDGTTSATTGANCAWDTIADVNASLFNAGDSVLFKRGCTWRETLTVPSSGSAGSPITFGAYGEGADPIIDGSDIISTWTEPPSTQNLETDYIEVDTTEHLTVSGTRVTFATLDRDDDSYVYKDFGAGYFSGDFSHNLTFVLTTATNSGFAFPWSMGNAVDDYKNMTTGAATRLSITIYGTGANVFKFGCVEDETWAWSAKTNYEPGTYYLTVRRVEAAGAEGTLYLDIYSDATRETLLETVTRTLTDKIDFRYLYAMNSYNAGTTGFDMAGYSENLVLGDAIPNVWQSSLTFTPDPVWFNEAGTITRGDKQTSTANLANKYDWYYDADADLLYVYSATDPDAAFTSIFASMRRGVYSDYEGAEYITLDGLAIQYTGGTYQQGIFVQNVVGWKIRNCTVAHVGTIEGVYADAILIDTSPNCLVENNAVYQAGTHGIYILDSDNAVVQDNDVYDCHHTLIDVQQRSDGACDGVIVRYNYCYYTATGGVVGSNGIYSEGAAAGQTVTNLSIYYNVVADFSTNTANNGIHLDANVASSSIYNNACYNNGAFSFYINNGTGTVVMKNNISKNTGGADHRCLRVVDVTNKTLDNNCYSVASGNFAAIASTDYSDWATYLAGETFDDNGMLDDPEFVSVVTPDFSLQSSSPCINAGVDVGLTTDYAGNTVPQGTVQDIGAYEFMYPAITGLDDATLSIGQSLTITGTNFTATEGDVKFNGTAATTITSWANTSIVVVVPAGTTDGNVIVYVTDDIYSPGSAYTMNATGGSLTLGIGITLKEG